MNSIDQLRISAMPTNELRDAMKAEMRMILKANLGYFEHDTSFYNVLYKEWEKRGEPWQTPEEQAFTDMLKGKQ